MNSNLKASVFLIEDMGDKQFSIEGVQFVAVSSFQLFVLYINNSFSYENRSQITYRILALDVPASRKKSHTKCI